MVGKSLRHLLTSFSGRGTTAFHCRRDFAGDLVGQIFDSRYSDNARATEREEHPSIDGNDHGEREIIHSSLTVQSIAGICDVGWVDSKYPDVS